METQRIPMIVCGGATGRAVIFCRMAKIPEPDESVVMYDARMVLRWDVPRGLFGLAQHGPNGQTRVTSPVAEVRDTCRQSLTVTEAAAAAFDAWPNA